MKSDLICVSVATAEVTSLQSAPFETGYCWSFLIIQHVTPYRCLIYSNIKTQQCLSHRLFLRTNFCWSSLVIGWRNLFHFTSVSYVPHYFVSLVPSIESPISLHRSVLLVMDCADCQTLGQEGGFWGVICEAVIFPCTGYSVMGVTEANLKSCSRWLKNAWTNWWETTVTQQSFTKACRLNKTIWNDLSCHIV